MKKKVVIALGGNALGNTPSEQLKLVKITAKTIVNLVQDGYRVIVTHGNGPQVGMINLAMESANETIDTPEMPFAECGAMSQGYIGYHLQQSVQEELLKRNMRKHCLTVISQVLVDKKDKAFQHPTKPIGSFYTKKEADQIAKEKGYVMVEDAKRGYRRVVPSPQPVKILELSMIEDLMDDGNIVIACGGGGVPVVKHYKGYKGIDAVIDKDKTSARLAVDLKADILLILTAVDKVYLHYKEENEEAIDIMNVKEAKEYIEEKQFAEGSMLPKVEACIDFVIHHRGGQAIITSLKKAEEALLGKTGTIIVRR